MCYPAGVELIESGGCPLGAGSPMACMFCCYGHMLECHYPMDCAEANCSHYQTEHGSEFSGEPDPEDLLDLAVCEFCGCSQFNACPGGCAWSEHYLEQGRAVCTQCERITIAFDVNWGMLNIWRANKDHNKYDLTEPLFRRLA